MKMKYLKIAFIFLIPIIIGLFIYLRVPKRPAAAPIENSTPIAPPKIEEKKDRVESLEIKNGTNFGELLSGAGVDYGEAMKIYKASEKVYDLVKIREGHFVDLIHDKDTDQLKEMRYKIDTEDELFIYKNQGASSTPFSGLPWQAKVKPIPYEVRIKVASSTVTTSMYQAALDINIDIKAIIELANVFQWTIDFAMDPRVGDTFQFVYEERYLDGKYAMPGRVLAGRYTNDGKAYYAYAYSVATGKTDEGDISYYDEKGNAAKKMFLRAPVEFKYISSPFTTGKRYVEAFNVSTGHRAIDYAASLGTPIRAVADGVITHAGWTPVGYGNLTSIRHNATYSTNYGHQSKILVKVGQRVKQGQVIGLVGSTGFSTGPHLHFEMVKNGTKINPQLEVQPPGQPIDKNNAAKFFEAIKDYMKMLE